MKMPDWLNARRILRSTGSIITQEIEEDGYILTYAAGQNGSIGIFLNGHSIAFGRSQDGAHDIDHCFIPVKKFDVVSSGGIEKWYSPCSLDAIVYFIPFK